MATLPKISELSDAEKYELIDTLWQDLEAHPRALSDEQVEELDRRVADYEANPSDVLSWEDVKAEQPRH